MARAKQASRRRAPARPAVPRALWGMVAAVLILFVGLLAWLGTREPQPESSVQTAPAQGAAQMAARQDARAVSTPPAREVVPPPPRYEFYNMLPSQKVEVPPPALPATGAVSAPATAPLPETSAPAAAASGPRYELQVGSFRSHKDADRRKAELALLGFSSSIQTASVNGETWHRVKMAAMPEAEARKVRDRLKAVGMNPLMVRQGG